MKRALFLAACLLAAHYSLPAIAASAIVYGERTVVTRSAPNLEDAVRSATERCARSDKGCSVLYSCSDPGYGYVAAAQVGGLIESVGGTCGQASPEKARDVAIELCSRNAKAAACELRATWIDR